VAPLAAAPPGEVLYERAEAPVTQDMDDGLLMEADEHMVLGQMMEVVEAYLHPEATELKELSDEMEAPVDVNSLVERDLRRVRQRSRICGCEGLSNCMRRVKIQPPPRLWMNSARLSRIML